jgi:two-component system, LuxR family, sensor kinase FixL
MGAYGYFALHQNLTEMILERRQAIANLSALTLKNWFDRLVDVGVTLGNRVQFRARIKEGKWAEAMAILEQIPKDLPYIDRIILSDKNGIYKADFPVLPYPDPADKDFSKRDWYLGVSREWKPYISSVYKRFAEPRRNVITVAVPIKDADKSVIGILVLQVTVEHLLEWVKEIRIAQSGFVYFVDSKAQVAIHPRFSGEGKIIDYSSVGIVQKALHGQRGVEVIYNPVESEQRLAAYEPIRSYGWAAIAQEPASDAFALREKILGSLFILYGFIFLLTCGIAFYVVYILQSLKRSEENVRVVVETARDAIISANDQNHIIAWNKASEIMFGYTKREALGKSLSMLMPEPFRQAHEMGFKRYLKTKEPRVIGRTILLEGLRKNGQEFPLEISLSAWQIKKKDFFTAILRDVSERIESEKQMMQKKEELARSKAELEQLELFAFVASHDLQEPLHKIIAFGELLKMNIRSKLDEKGWEYFERIEKAAVRMQHLMEDTLQFSRVATRGAAFTEFDLSKVIEEVESDLELRINETQGKIEVGKLPVIYGDYAQVRQVFQNLIGNALKYRHPEVAPVIRIESETKDGWVEITVKDNGIGFEQIYADRIFKPFQRLHGRDKYEGNGIGLAICKKILTRHGGSISAKSELGSGSTFIVKFRTLNNKGGL